MRSRYSVNSVFYGCFPPPARLRKLEFPVNFGFTRNAEGEAAFAGFTRLNSVAALAASVDSDG